MDKYIGNGKVYNLPESQIIAGNNLTIELTILKLELEKLAKILFGESNNDTDSDNPNNTTSKPQPGVNTSIIDISECEALLKKKYNLPEEEELIIVKGDILQQLTE